MRSPLIIPALSVLHFFEWSRLEAGAVTHGIPKQAI
jgi:hypothetical protein